MPACETQIPVSKDVRHDLRVIKAEDGYGSYDEALTALIETHREN